MMIHRRKLGSAHTPCIGLEIKGGDKKEKPARLRSNNDQPYVKQKLVKLNVEFVVKLHFRSN